VTVTNNIAVAPADWITAKIAHSTTSTITSRIVVLFRTRGAVRAEPVVAASAVAAGDTDADDARGTFSVRVAIIPSCAVASAVGIVEVIWRAIMARVVVELQRTMLAFFAKPLVSAIAVAAIKNVAADEFGVTGTI
jgi:hypothetical protein